MPRHIRIRKVRNGTEPVAVRLGVDIDQIVEARASAEGISKSELIRNVMHAWAYGEAPGANEGYYQARRTATEVTRFLLLRSLDTLPATPEEFEQLVLELRATGGLDYRGR